VRSPSCVDRDPCERLVHRDRGIRKSADTSPVAEGVIEGLPEGDSCVLHRVMLIDMEIADSSNFQVERTVESERCKEVVVHADTGFNIGYTSPVGDP
jgi:hypothetical protein